MVSKTPWSCNQEFDPLCSHSSNIKLNLSMMYSRYVHLSMLQAQMTIVQGRLLEYKTVQVLWAYGSKCYESV